MVSHARNSPTDSPAKVDVIARGDHVAGRVLDDVGRELHPQARHDELPVAEDEDLQRDARRLARAGSARMADVGDQLVVGEGVELVLGARAE